MSNDGMSNVMDFTLPEVAILHQKARFLKEDGVDIVEISFVGSKDTVKHKVRPIHMAQFREQWNAYCDGSPVKQREGTPLTDLSTIKELRVDHYIGQNIHNLEELAALSDAQCQALGHGTLTDRESARKLLSQRQLEESTRLHEIVTRESAKIGPVPAEKYASAGDLAAVNEKIDALTNNVAALVAALQPKKRGRPPKEETP